MNPEIQVPESLMRKALARRGAYLQHQERNPVYLQILIVLQTQKSIERYLDSRIYSENGFTKSRFNELTVLHAFLIGKTIHEILQSTIVNKSQVYNYIQEFVSTMSMEYQTGIASAGRDQYLTAYCEDAHLRYMRHHHYDTGKFGGNPCPACNGTLERIDGVLLISRQFE